MRLVRPVVAFALLTFAAPSARAEEPAKAAAPKPIPPLATTVDAKAAIAAFKAEFKGKDVAKKADAVDALGAVNHPFVVDELVKVTRHKDPELRAAAYQNLERQRAIPDVAGKAVLSGLDLKSKDVEAVTHVIDTVEVLRHRGSLPVLLALCRHDDHAIVRAALDAIGDMKDVRALDAVLELLKELKVEDGVKWDGASASVDTGTAGNGDQQAAEAQARAAAAGNARKGKSAARRLQLQVGVRLEETYRGLRVGQGRPRVGREAQGRARRQEEGARRRAEAAGRDRQGRRGRRQGRQVGRLVGRRVGRRSPGMRTPAGDREARSFLGGPDGSRGAADASRVRSPARHGPRRPDGSPYLRDLGPAPDDLTLLPWMDETPPSTGGRTR